MAEKQRQRYALREQDRTALCRDCGAVVWDTARHDRWHAKLDLIGPARFELPPGSTLGRYGLSWPDDEET